MNIWARRTYFLFTVLLFAIIATLLIYYATGWRYNTETRSLGKAGALSVDTEPDKASVYLNGKILNNKSPLSENNLIAQQYSLTINKEGYYDWRQDLIIEEAKTTFIPQAYLIKKQNLDNLYLSSNISSYKFSNNKKNIAFESGGQIIIYDLERNEKIHEEIISTPIINYYWNTNDESVIYEDQNNFFLLNLTDNNITPTSLNESFEIIINKIFWSNDESNIIYAQQGNNLYRLNKFQKTKELILSDQNILYQHSQYFFTINDLNELSVISQAGETIEQKILPENFSLKFYKNINQYLPIIDVHNEQGYYFDLNENNFIEIEEQLNSIDFSDTNLLIYSNAHEIWNIDNIGNSSNLIIRTSEAIKNAYWLIKNQYIIYTTDNNQIKIRELNRPTNNTYQIDHQLINNLEKGYEDNIFFLINKLGLYKLEF